MGGGLYAPSCNGFLPITKKNSELFPTLYCGCPYAEKNSEDFCFLSVKSPMEERVRLHAEIGALPLIDGERARKLYFTHIFHQIDALKYKSNRRIDYIVPRMLWHIYLALCSKYLYI